MANEAFKAEVVIGAKDLTGGALKGIGSGLKGIVGDLKGIGRVSGLPRVGQALKGVGRSMWDVAKSSARVLANLTGIGAIGVAGVFVGLTAALKGSAEQLDDISKTARQLRMPMQTLREFAHVAGLQGVSWETATEGLKKAGKTYFELQNGIGRARKQLEAINPVLGRQIRNAKDSTAALDIMLEAIHSAGSSEESAKLSELFFGTDEFTKIAELSGAEFAAAMDKARKLLGTMTDEQGRAIEDTNDSIEKFQTSLKGLRDQLAADLWPAMQPVIEGMTKWVSENREWIRTSISGGVGEIVSYLKEIDWRAVGDDVRSLFAGLRDAIGSMSKLVEAMGGWKPVLVGLAGLALAGPIADIARLAVSLGSLASAIGGLSAMNVPAWLLALMGVGTVEAVRQFSNDVHAGNLKPGARDYSEGFSREENAARDYQQWHGVPFEGGMHRAGRGAGPQPGSLPRRARGGRVDPGRWTIVGEEGMELLRVGPGGQVFPAGQTRALLGDEDPDTATRVLARALLEPARIIAEPLKPLGPALKELKDTIDDLAGTGLVGGGAGGGSAASAGGFRVPRIGGQGETGPGGSSGGGAWRGGDIANATDAKNYLMSAHGFTSAQASGVVGNLMQESGPGLNPTIVGDGGRSVGIAQWNGNRLAGMKAWIAARGKDWRERRQQLDYLVHELATTERTAGDAIRRSQTVEEATAAAIGFERPAGWSARNPRWGHGWGNRLAYARRMAAAAVPSPAPDTAIIEDRAERFRPALRTPPASRQQVDIGKGELRVTIDRDGRVTGVKPSFDGNLSVNAGFDRTGRRTFTPGFVGKN